MECHAPSMQRRGGGFGARRRRRAKDGRAPEGCSRQMESIVSRSRRRVVMLAACVHREAPSGIANDQWRREDLVQGLGGKLSRYRRLLFLLLAEQLLHGG